MANHVVWFDMPVLDLERAIQFYSNVLGVKLEKPSPDMPMAVFEGAGEIVTGCLFVDEANKPSATGLLLYFNVNDRLTDAVAKAEAHGGKVLIPVHQIGPYGYRAIVLDSEGNRISLHSEKES